MARNLFFIFAVLLLAVSGALFWQWKEFTATKKIDQAKNNSDIEQQILLKVDDGTLTGTQIFEKLQSKHLYKIVIQDPTIKWSCINENGKPCPSLKNDPFTFQPQSGKLRIQFSKKLNKNTSLLLEKNLFPMLIGVNTSKIKIEIVDSFFRKGTWVVGLPLKGYNKLEHIDYYQFEGVSENPLIYWQKTPLFITNKNKSYMIYSQSAGEINVSPKLPKEKGYMVFVKTNTPSEISSAGMLITKENLSSQLIQKVWVTNYFNQKFNGTVQKNDWVVDGFSSLYLNQNASTSKGKFMIEQLKSKMESSNIQKLVTFVMQETKIVPEELDQQLEKEAGMKTDFFKNNLRNEKKLATLFFYDKREIIANGKSATTLNCILENNVTLFPFNKTMQSLGYQVEKLDSISVSLSKNNNQYVFHFNQNSFFYNNQEYGLLENPFSEKNGVIYINQEGLHSLFKVQIAKTEKMITINN